MNNNVKGILAVVGVGAIVAGILYMTKNKKRHYAKVIVKLAGSSNFADILTFEEPFLKAWSIALSKGEKTFSYQGKSYNTKGGRAVQLSRPANPAPNERKAPVKPTSGIDFSQSYNRISF